MTERIAPHQAHRRPGVALAPYSAVALTDALIAATGPLANVMPSPFNADLQQAETLRDNHSVKDHGVGPVTVGDLFAN